MANRKTPDRGAGDERPARRYAAVVAVAILGSAGYVVRFAGLPDGIPPVYLAFHLVPAWLAIGIALAGVRTARDGGDAVREERWRWLLIGVAVAPAAAGATALVAAPAYGAVDAFIAGGMVGASLAISTAFGLVVHAAATRARRVDTPVESLAVA